MMGITIQARILREMPVRRITIRRMDPITPAMLATHFRIPNCSPIIG
jgi:hypothetical protein